MKNKAISTGYISQQADDLARKEAIRSMLDMICRNMNCRIVKHELLVVDPRNGYKAFFPADVYAKAKQSRLIGLVVTAETEKV